MKQLRRGCTCSRWALIDVSDVMQVCWWRKVCFVFREEGDGMTNKGVMWGGKDGGRRVKLRMLDGSGVERENGEIDFVAIFHKNMGMAFWGGRSRANRQLLRLIQVTMRSFEGLYYFGQQTTVWEFWICSKTRRESLRMDTLLHWREMFVYDIVFCPLFHTHKMIYS